MIALAARLRALPRDTLVAALTARAIEPNGVRDVFDLAEAILQPESIDRALGRLSRPLLAVLAVVGEAGEATTVAAIAERLSALGADVTEETVRERTAALEARLLLVRPGEDAVLPLDAVSARLAAWPERGLPGTAELAAAAPPTLVAESADTRFIDRVAAERAFLTLTALAEIIGAMSLEPARELSRGGLSLPDSKRLAQTAGIELDALPFLVDLAARCGLVVREGGYRLESERGEEWMLMPSPERWRTLVAAWRATLPAEVLAIVAPRASRSWGTPLRDEVGWLYPAGGSWLEQRIAAVSRDAEALGLASDGRMSTLGRLVIGDDIDSGVDALAGLVPAHVDRVYLQHDLSIVSPGPLEPTLDARLRTMADVEGRELASSYRVSHGSVNRALTGGETAASILGFLSGLSLTGVPQPLDYLVHEAAERYGRVRVGTVGTAEFPARSYVRSEEAELIGTIVVDQSLSAIGLRQTGPHRLLSRFAPEVVFWALSNARYPVAAEGADGQIVRMRRHHVAAAAAPADPRDPIGELVDRLLTADAGDLGTEQAWLARQLEAAVNAKLALTVSVRMPGGSIADYVLEPTSVANGRMRARDRKSDIERTLPLSAIAAVSPAPADA